MIRRPRWRCARPAEPVSDFTPWAGRWVAVKDGVVIASSPNLQDLVPLLRAMGKRAHGAVAHYVSVHRDETEEAA